MHRGTQVGSTSTYNFNQTIKLFRGAAHVIVQSKPEGSVMEFGMRSGIEHVDKLFPVDSMQE